MGRKQQQQHQSAMQDAPLNFGSSEPKKVSKLENMLDRLKKRKVKDMIVSCGIYFIFILFFINSAVFEVLDKHDLCIVFFSQDGRYWRFQRTTSLRKR